MKPRYPRSLSVLSPPTRGSAQTPGNQGGRAPTPLLLKSPLSPGQAAPVWHGHGPRGGREGPPGSCPTRVGELRGGAGV